MTETDVFARIISVTALLISLFTIWLTFFRRGTVRMTKPSFVAFKYDNGPKIMAKIFIRSLLYSTGKRGHAIENMYVILRRGETQQTFNVWGYGEQQGLVRGSGLFVGETGISVNHHFNPPSDVDFKFVPGDYEIRVFTKLVTDESSIEICLLQINVPESARVELDKPDMAIWFDWAPESGRYHAHIEKGLD